VPRRLGLAGRLDRAGHVAEQARENLRSGEVSGEACVLGLALLQQLVFVQYGLERDVFAVE
jgi:hypothetical protein